MKPLKSMNKFGNFTTTTALQAAPFFVDRDGLKQ